MKPTLLTVDGKEYPVMWNRRAKANWEEVTGVTWEQLRGTLSADGERYLIEPIPMSIKMAMHICHEALREGYRLNNKSFDIEFDEVYTLCEKGLEEKILPIVYPKLSPSTQMES